GLYSVIGILQALISRTSTGVGQRVDISMHDSVLAFNNENISNASVIAGSGERPPDMVLAPFGYYKANDGWLALVVGPGRHWIDLCELAGWDDWLGGEFEDRMVRVEKHDSVIQPRLHQW